MTAQRDLAAERDHAEFAGWMEAQGYRQGRAYCYSDMGDAFTAGMEAARALAVAAPAAPQSVPGLVDPAAHEADIASLTDQRNRVSATADQLRAQVRNLRDALERCRDAAGSSPAAVHTIASQALASSQMEGL